MARSPLFDIYDPYDLLTQQGRLGLLPQDEEEMEITGAFPLRRKPALSDLMPEEQQQSMLSKLAAKGTSGLAGLGWVLDTPGAMVRGLLSGGPGKAVSALWETSEDRVDGRELLRQYGVVGDQDGWGNFAAGLGAEILLDPLTLVNPLAVLGKKAAYGAAGRAAQRAGLLDDVAVVARKQGMGPREFVTSRTARDVIGDNADAAQRFADAAAGKGLNADDLLDQPLSGLMEARLPGFETGTLLGTGETGRRVARAVDQFGEKLATNSYTAPVVNRMTRAFDPSVMERLDYEDQWRAREAFYGAKKSERNFREEAAKAYLAARQAGDQGGLSFDSPQIQAAIRDTIEARLDPERVAQLQDQDAINLLESTPAWREYRDWYASKLDDVQNTRAGLGLETPNAESLYDTGFMPSQVVRFGTDRTAEIPGKLPRQRRPYEKGAAVYATDELVGKSRRPYLDLERRSETLRRLMAGESGAQLRDRLYGATPEQMPGVIDEAFEALGLEAPYTRVRDAEGNSIRLLEAELADQSLDEATRVAKQKAMETLQAKAGDMKVQLGDLLRTSDRQFADAGLGLFDRHTMSDILRYGSGGARSEANASVLVQELQKLASDIPADQMPGGGAVPLLEGAKKLGFNEDRLKQILQEQMPGKDVSRLSISEEALAQLGAVQKRATQFDDSALTNLYDSYTNLFKVGVLANPAYHTRNAYSGGLATVMSGGMRPDKVVRNMLTGLRAGKGNYDDVYEALKDAPAFQGLSKEEAINKFLEGAARNKLGQGLVMEGSDDVATAAPNLLPGMDTQSVPPWFGDGGLLYDKDRSWQDWLTVRGVDFGGVLSPREAPRETLNPLLKLHERASRRVEDANRLGAYISGLQQGFSPDAAADLVAKTQVDYSPQAFTAFERQLKKYVPFYSYPRGITPLIAENLLERPGGYQGQAIRAMNAGTRPSEENFTPEHLRASVAIPLPWSPAGENIQRYLTNIDTPFESVINLFSPGIGNDAGEVAYDTVKRTATNLAGQLNPIFKGPLEWLVNRQLYTGRQLSDLYSALEQDQIPGGRTLEQIIANSPLSRLNSIYRTVRDDRLSPADRAVKLFVNNTLGAKVTDIDQEKTKRLAARDMLNQLLETTPGVRTYENLTVPEEVVRAMAPEQRDMYLLYKIIQSEAAKRARDRKKREQALDPLEVLGVVNQF